MGTSSISICKKKILNTLEASPALLSLLDLSLLLHPG